MRTSRAILVVILALIAVFAVGVTRLFNLRFAAGDVYPPYSSLRADPLGCKALYESIDALPGFTVTRNYRPLTKLSDNGHQTIFLFGIPEEEMMNVSEKEAGEIKRLLMAGNRLVVTLYPVWKKDEEAKKKKTLHPNKNTIKKQANDKDEDQPEFKFVSLEKLWGFKLAHAEAATNALWHTTLYFDHFTEEWNTLVSRGRYPAIIERNFGPGSLVLCADSYFVSNEALRRTREPDLLATLIGPDHAVTFDEVHLGVTESPGLTTLARHYGLHGLLIGLLILAALFVWKSTCSFLPPYPDAQEPAVESGKDSAAGFVNLLRRSIPPSQVLTVCLAEWQKSFAHSLRRSNHKLERVQAVVNTQNAQPTRQRNPVEGYRSIAAILKERK